MNDPQYQAGSLWAIGGALRPLSEALGSRFERKKIPQKSQKNPQKKEVQAGSISKFPCPLAPRWCSLLGERAGGC